MTLPSIALRRGASLSISLLLVGVLAACSGAAPSESTDDTSGGGTIAVTGGVAEISAAELEFDANVIQAPAGEPFTVAFTNDDTVPHNWSLYTGEGGEPIALGDIIDGGATDEVEVPALEPGEYFFVCDLHTNMTGTVVVEG